MKDAYIKNSEKKFLIDYARFSDTRLQVHFKYVVDYLRGNMPFMKLLKHAEALPMIDCQERPIDLEETVAQLTPKEVQPVRRYLFTIAAYLTNGTQFDSVNKAADTLIDLKPIPEAVIAPSDSVFYEGEPGRTLADMREQV